MNGFCSDISSHGCRNCNRLQLLFKAFITCTGSASSVGVYLLAINPLITFQCTWWQSVKAHLPLEGSNPWLACICIDKVHSSGPLKQILILSRIAPCDKIDPNAMNYLWTLLLFTLTKVQSELKQYPQCISRIGTFSSHLLHPSRNLTWYQSFSSSLKIVGSLGQ